jgi:hypothetical protein
VIGAREVEQLDRLGRPTSRGSVHDEPVSQDSAMPANARLKPAVSASTRKSQANARLAPGTGGDPVDRGDDRLRHRRDARSPIGL